MYTSFLRVPRVAGACSPPLGLFCCAPSLLPFLSSRAVCRCRIVSYRIGSIPSALKNRGKGAGREEGGRFPFCLSPPNRNRGEPSHSKSRDISGEKEEGRVKVRLARGFMSLSRRGSGMKYCEGVTKSPRGCFATSRIVSPPTDLSHPTFPRSFPSVSGRNGCVGG